MASDVCGEPEFGQYSLNELYYHQQVHDMISLIQRVLMRLCVLQVNRVGQSAPAPPVVFSLKYDEKTRYLHDKIRSLDPCPNTTLEYLVLMGSSR